MLGIRGLAEQPQSKKKLPSASCQRNEISTIENPSTLYLLHLPIFLCLFYEIGGKGKSTLTPRTSRCSYSDRVRYPPQTIRNPVCRVKLAPPRAAFRQPTGTGSLSGWPYLFHGGPWAYEEVEGNGSGKGRAAPMSTLARARCYCWLTTITRIVDHARIPPPFLFVAAIRYTLWRDRTNRDIHA